jgi:hypothetical protein
MRRTRIERACACHWLLGMCLAFATALTSAHASAEPVEARAQARSHFDQGVAFSRRHAYVEALNEFQRAYQAFPHFSVLYNIGQALIALDRPTEAIAVLNRYLEEGGANIEPRRREEVSAAIASESAKTGSIEVSVDVDGALVTIDDKPYGRSPLATPFRVDSGAHRVLAALDSGERSEAKVDVKAGQVAPIQLVFDTRSSSAPAASPARGQLRIRCAENGLTVVVDDQPFGVTPLASPLWLQAGNHRVRFERGSARSGEQPLSVIGQREHELSCSVPTTVLTPQAQREQPAALAHSTQKTLAYAIGAAGLALSGAALAHFLWNRARYEDWQSRYSAYYDDPTEQNRESANDLAESVSNASAVTVGLAIGAGVALGTGTALLLSSGSTRAAGNAGMGGPFMTLRGAF